MLNHMARTVDARVRARPLVPFERWSPDFVVDLLENFEAYLRMDVAASSQRTYDAGLRRYSRFCQRLQAPLLPAAEGPYPTLLSIFIIGCARANLRCLPFVLVLWTSSIGLQMITACLI
jgi:hypothetical protein